MPSGFFAQHVTARLEPLVTTFLLPLFFVYSGLNTQVGLVNTPTLWAGGDAGDPRRLDRRQGNRVHVGGAAQHGSAPRVRRTRVVDERPRADRAHSSQYRARSGRHHPTLFSILVLIAIVTTLMATPIFEFVYGRHQELSNNSTMGSSSANAYSDGTVTELHDVSPASA